MPGLDCKQVVCINKLQAQLRSVEQIARREEFSDEDYKTVINCAETAIADLDDVLSNYTT